MTAIHYPEVIPITTPGPSSTLGISIPGPGPVEWRHRDPPPPLALAALASPPPPAAPGPPSRFVKRSTRATCRPGWRPGATLWLGQGKQPFPWPAERFNPDCSGFVEAVYAAEGIPLRRLAQRAAPGETSGVAALWAAAGRYGSRWRGGEWPAPGDLVFFDDTWDRNGNGRLRRPLHAPRAGRVGRPAAAPSPSCTGPGPAWSGATSRSSAAAPCAPPDGASSTRPCGCGSPRTTGPRRWPGELFVGFGRIDPARARAGAPTITRG